MASGDECAVNDTKMEEYMETLIGGSATFQGVMRRNNKITLRKNVPFKHQRRAVEKWSRHNAKGTEFMLLNHDMGTGKSAVLMQMYAKMSVEKERKIKMIVSVPVVTLEQWRDTVAGWTTIKQDRILVTSDSKNVTAHTLVCCRFSKSVMSSIPATTRCPPEEA